jgi:hypothetical protein
MNSNQLSVALVLALCVVGGTAFAEDGVSDGKIVFGQVAALQGPAQALGQGMRQGILAAFDAANRTGGISGRKLELKSLEDGYEPEKTPLPNGHARYRQALFMSPMPRPRPASLPTPCSAPALDLRSDRIGCEPKSSAFSLRSASPSHSWALPRRPSACTE